MSALLRALMGQPLADPTPPSGDVVMDGLVFRLNGMNQGGIENAWIDEIGGKRFDVFAKYGSIQQRENGFEFFAARGAYMECRTSDLFPTAGTTIEICANVTLETGHATMLFCQGQPAGTDRNWTVCFTGLGPNKFWIGNKVDGVPNLPAWDMKVVSGIITNSLTETTALQNEQQLSYTKTNSWSSSDVQSIRLGEGMGPGAPLRGMIHEIRIYNRILTDEERAFNYQHDKSTYLEV